MLYHTNNSTNCKYKNTKIIHLYIHEAQQKTFLFLLYLIIILFFYFLKSPEKGKVLVNSKKYVIHTKAKYYTNFFTNII